MENIQNRKFISNCYMDGSSRKSAREAEFVNFLDEHASNWEFEARGEYLYFNFYACKDTIMTEEDMEYERQESFKRFEKYYDRYEKLIKLAKKNGIKIKPETPKSTILWLLEINNVEVPKELC